MRNLTQLALLCLVGMFVSYTTVLTAQKEGNVWIFGHGLGLDFTKSKPKLIETAAINTYEGCSSISDRNGKLLLYTDGINVWNKAHKMMENGDSLHGHPSSTQSGIIIAKPQSRSIYYVFTVDACENGLAKGLEYAEIDISENKGLGKVTQKHVSLLPLAEEKVTGVVHQNGQDIWVITHKWNTNEFHAFLVDKNGVSSKPVISKTGSIHKGVWENSIGYLKASPQGDKLALALHLDGFFEVFDFDNTTGKVSNGLPTGQFEGKPYGIEFSSNGRFLYVSTMADGEIVQYDLRKKDRAATLKKKRLIRKSNKDNIGSLQLARNGRIYYQIFGSKNLGVIRYPNKPGEKTEIKDKALKIPKSKGRYGLPTFVQTYFSKENIRKAKSMPAEVEEIVEVPKPTKPKVIEEPKKEPKKEIVKVIPKTTIEVWVNERALENPNDPNSAVTGYMSVEGANITDVSTNKTFTPAKGRWSFEIGENTNYTFKFSKQGYFTRSMTITADEIQRKKAENPDKIEFPFLVERIVKNKEIVLEDVYFNYNKADLTDNSKAILSRLVTLLEENPKLLIQLSAHTDCRGSGVYNLGLSERRAASVMNYLIEKQIQKNRLTSKGYGETQPRATCVCVKCSEEEHQSNRRVTFKVVGTK